MGKYNKIEGVNYDINNRWETGVEHREESEKLFKKIMELDFEFGNDFFWFKKGGDGDNGEHLMYLLDIYFDEQDILKNKK